MKHNTLKPEFFHFIPETLEEGILYISLEYSAVLHKCCCGCGQVVSTPISNGREGWDGGWTLTNENGLVSLHPSIGNFQIPCKTHYFIKNNEVIWC